MEIRHKETGAILFKDESPTIRETLENAAQKFRETVKASVQGGTDENRQTIWKINQDLLKTAPDLRGANLKGADLSGIELHGIECRFMNVHTDDLSTNTFEFPLAEADLSGANLAGANLSRVNFEGAVLNDANLSRACLNLEEDEEASLGM
jgi:uncharacterized protein YjbI with pentapeptide repeats